MPDKGQLLERKPLITEPKTFGDVLRSRRAERGLTQRELAALLSVTRDRIQDWEYDRVAPSAEHLRRLAEVIGLSVNPPATSPNS